ncbi:MAG: HAD family hydrolase, partial [Candidatus Aenigmatarchaeota archaeon]
MHSLLKKDFFIIDIDGVISRGETPIQENIKAVEKLREMGKRVIFISNNSTRSRKIMMRRFRKHGLKVSEEELLMATYATARFISKEKKRARVFTTGEPGL